MPIQTTNGQYLEKVWYHKITVLESLKNYRLKVLTHCGWDGIINLVRMNAYPQLMVEPEVVYNVAKRVKLNGARGGIEPRHGDFQYDTPYQ